MAPFKLKFRMGNSRSTSQEHESDPQVNEALLNHQHSTAIGASSSTIDSADCNSVGSLSINERRSLLPNKTTTDLRLGYHNRSASSCVGESATDCSELPTTPPPSYERVLEENTHSIGNINSNPEAGQQFHSVDNYSTLNQHNTINLAALGQLALNGSPCTDPDCQENYMCATEIFQLHDDNVKERNSTEEYSGQYTNCARNNETYRNRHDDDDEHNDNDAVDNRKESIDSTELLISTKMASPSSHDSRSLVEGCDSSCQQYDERQCDGQCDENCQEGNNEKGASGDFFDPLINHGGYCNDETHYNDQYGEHSQHECDYEEQRCDSDNDNDGGWDANDMSNSHSQQQHSQQHQQQQQQQQQELTPEIISNKSSKEIYKDLAKQWGITCKMSDACRCMECQSHYFDCEFDDNEHQKTDGGLGAGTPMFISEVMHGSACNIL